MIILYDNLVEDATITSSSETYLYEDDSIVTIDSYETWKSETDTGEYIVFQTSGIQPDIIGIKNHNLSNSATIKIQGNATDSWGSPSFSKTLTWRSGVILEEIAPASSYAYWRFYIDDASNADGFIEIGVFYIGNALELTLSPDPQIKWNTNSAVEFSTSNQPYGDSRSDFYTYEIQTAILTNAKRKSVQTMFQTVKNITPIFMGMWEDDYDFEVPMYCVLLEAERGFTKDENNNFSMSLQFREVQ